MSEILTSTDTAASVVAARGAAGPRLRGMRWGLGALLGAAAVVAYSVYGDPQPDASEKSGVPILIAASAVVAVLAFGLLVPAGLRAIAGGSSRWSVASLVISLVGLVSMLGAFWSGVPFVLGVASGVLAADSWRARRAASARVGAIFGPAVARRVMDYFARPRASVASLAFPQLTDREHEILELLAQGHSNAAIATRLRISAKTVRDHVSNIFTKLAVADRAQAIVRARDAGLGGAHAG